MNYFNDNNKALLTDFYQLTMMQGYFFFKRNTNVIFDYFFRKMPFNSGYCIFAGLETLIDFIINFKFSERDIDYLKNLNVFKEEFISFLRTIYDLYYKNMPLNKTFIYRGKPVPIERPAMKRLDKFRLTGSTELSNKLIQRQEEEQTYGLLREDPIVNPVKLITDLIKSSKPDGGNFFAATNITSAAGAGQSPV